MQPHGGLRTILSPKELTVTDSPEIRAAYERAAETAYRVCAETRHVTLGDKVRDAILALSPEPSTLAARKPRP